MKDITNMKDYRKKLKRYYGIEFSKNYVVHHIDFDRSNNDISNLMILPRDLHGKYHLCVEACGMSPTDVPYEKIFDARIGTTQYNGYQMMMMEHLCEVICECAKWYDYKRYLDGAYPNVHGIELE